MGRTLRSGFTTGACAAAAAKAAAVSLLSQDQVSQVKVVFPDRAVVAFEIFTNKFSKNAATASVIKDAGDDPDVTNGAVIEAEVRLTDRQDIDSHKIDIKGGIGVGVVTKPGLAVKVGSPAINPVPISMITENVSDAIAGINPDLCQGLEVIITVPDGVELAKKTLNERLGIIGGISILGTTGIVKPVSAEAWTATIISSMDVAEANGVKEIILSTGRTSERAVQQLLNPQEEALVMMGDYLKFSLQQVENYSFTKVHVATMWAKLLKGAMGHAQTHVRHGILDTENVCAFLTDNNISQAVVEKLKSANTAREILDILVREQAADVIAFVCRFAAKKYQGITGIPVSVHLVNSNGTIMAIR